MTRRPTAIGMETPMNVPFCKAGPVDGTSLASIMPKAMERMIHITRNRSKNERALKGGALTLLSWRATKV